MNITAWAQAAEGKPPLPRLRQRLFQWFLRMAFGELVDPVVLRLQAVPVQPGDTLVLSTPLHLDELQRRRMEIAVRTVFRGDVRAIVLDEGLRLEDVLHRQPERLQ